TDKLSVEKLQEQNKTMKLALVELSDENIYDNTGFFANEYAKNLVEQIDAGEIETIVERCIRNHQEQLNTAKK
ncbi:putative phage related protein, partial [Lactococcus cremoris subsp. cremoris GE214]